VSANPPLSAFTAARTRQQSAVSAFAPATIYIGGTGYACAASTASREIELGSGGFATVMAFEASLPKSLYPTEPVVGGIVKLDGLGFKITEVDGRNSFETTWVLRGQRVPGQDA
jgi:hypothetical protein